MINLPQFEQVMGVGIAKVGTNLKDNNLYYSLDHNNIRQHINIHELAQKCKDWAFDLGFDIETAPSGWIRISKDDSILYSHSGLDNEKQEAQNSIKAFQWVFENQKKYK